MKKNIILIFVAMLMVFSMIPLTAYAMYDDDAEKGKYFVNPPVGLTLTYNGKEQSGVRSFERSNFVNDYGYDVNHYKATNAGKYTATACLWGDMGPQTFVWSDGTIADKKITFTIKKAINPLQIKAKVATVKYSGVKKKTRKVAVTKVIKFTKKGQGKMTYKKVNGNKKITIAKTTGKVKIKKGLKRGSYKVKVKVKAAGNNNYKKSAWKTVTFRIKVK